jgi:hypothetical protein
MSSKRERESKRKPLILNRGGPFLSIIRYVVSAWLDYIDLMSWATIVVVIIFVLTGEIFTRNGLILLLIIIPIPVLLRYLDKWLKKIDRG